MGNSIKTVVSSNLKQARLDAGLQRAEVAEALNIDDRTIGHYETGRSEPKLEILSEMSKLYNKPIGYFFDEDSALSQEKLNNTLIDRIIYDLIEEDVLPENIDFDQLDEHYKQILLSALKGHISKLRNKKRP